MDNAQETQDNIFAAALAAQRSTMKLGRQQMALEVLRIMNEEKVDSRAFARIAALCTREAKP